MSVGGSEAHAWIRHRNRALVLNIIRRRGRVSRADIVEASNLSLPTVSQITQSLLVEGMIEEIAIGPSRGGRRPALIAIRPDYGWVIGMKIYPGTIDMAVTNYLGELLASQEVQTPTGDVKQVAADICAIVEQLRRKDVPFTGRCLGIGIAVPGIVWQASGMLRNSSLGWPDLDFRALLQNQLNLPVMLDNDVNILAQGHLLFGQAQGLQNVLVVTIGRGFGLGLIMRGSVYRGNGGAAAEIGHIPWKTTANRCACGRYDCIENTISDAGALARYRELVPDAELPIEALRELAVAGVSKAVSVFEEMGREAAKAIFTLVNIVAPELIILSGEGLAAGPALVETLKREWDSLSAGGIHQPLKWVIDSWDNFLWARSAVSLVFDELIFPETARGPALRT